jgi:NAD(P)-dependent dehydrogenase (short-subunit alcohol dehydrogenase family)
MNAAALITGASRGIGRGIALELAGTPHDLVINYAGNEAAARQTAADCVAAAQARGQAIRAEIFRADVGSPADRAALIDFTRSTFGRLDVLVNNAGITSIGRADILEATEDHWDRLMAVNLKGPFFLTQAAARWMIEQHASPPPGIRTPKIVTISSISAHTVSTNRADYCMAKTALNMMTQLYAARLADHGIQVFEIRPGVIDSDMTAPVKDKYDTLVAGGLAPMRRWGTPGDVGKAVAAIVLDYLPYSTGDTRNVDGGFHVRRL